MPVCTSPKHLTHALKPIYKELARIGSTGVFHIHKLCAARGQSSTKFAQRWRPACGITALNKQQQSVEKRRFSRSRACEPYFLLYLLASQFPVSDHGSNQAFGAPSSCTTSCVSPSWLKTPNAWGRNSLTHSHCFNLNSHTIIATLWAPMISSSIYLS